MREIKFRAWAKYLETMVEVKHLHRGGDILPVGFANIFEAEGIELMQYTGLKDKNGKEIYEGDILKDNSGKIYVQEWGNVKIIKAPINATTVFLWEEIIGNIYKNPELLK